MDVNDLYQSEDKCCHWCNSSGENLKIGGRSSNEWNIISLNRFVAQGYLFPIQKDGSKCNLKPTATK